MIYRHRCTRADCRMRISLSKPADAYYKPRRCYCGGRLAIDNWRHQHEVGEGARRSRRVCRCGGWWFPHRVGSLGCAHHEGPTADQIAAYFGPYAAEASP